MGRLVNSQILQRQTENKGKVLESARKSIDKFREGKQPGYIYSIFRAQNLLSDYRRAVSR